MFSSQVRFLAFLLSMPGVRLGFVIGRSYDEIEAVNSFCQIGMGLSNCTDFLNPPKAIHRNAIEFCCNQNKFLECDPRLEHLDPFCKTESSKYDTCCVACGFGDEIFRLHPMIFNCCRCGELRSLQRAERSEKCRPGMFFNEPLQTCEDIDECNIRNNGCFDWQICVNTRGSYYCVPRHSCRLGFDFNPKELTCERQMEYETSIIIREFDAVEDSAAIESRNVTFAPQITCHAGYSYNYLSKTCLDINECSQRLQTCSHDCRNLQGSYRCICPEGFKLGRDDRTCIDVDECLLSPTICGTNVCNNVHGSFICYPPKCPAGYRLKKRQRHNNLSKCLRLLCGDKNMECRKQPKMMTFKNVTMRITADPTPREIVLHNIRNADYKVQVKLRLRVVDMETKQISMKIKHFKIMQQQNRSLLLLDQPFMTSEHLKLVIIAYTSGRESKILVFDKITLDFVVED